MSMLPMALGYFAFIVGCSLFAASLGDVTVGRPPQGRRMLVGAFLAAIGLYLALWPIS